LRKSRDKKKIKALIKKDTFETKILEKLIIKTAALLALGFGEAGGRIITENMRKGDCLNPMVAGEKVVGIFAFCDIRNFTDMTEIL